MYLTRESVPLNKEYFYENNRASQVFSQAKFPLNSMGQMPCCFTPWEVRGTDWGEIARHCIDIERRGHHAGRAWHGIALGHMGIARRADNTLCYMGTVWVGLHGVVAGGTVRGCTGRDGMGLYQVGLHRIAGERVQWDCIGMDGVRMKVQEIENLVLWEFCLNNG